MLRSLRSLSFALAVAIFLAPAAANAKPSTAKQRSAHKTSSKKSTAKKTSTAKKKATTAGYPVVTKIRPRFVMVGQKLAIYGKGFRPGAKKSSVAFYRSGKPVVFIKADTASKTKLTVTITEKVATLLKPGADGNPTSTMLRIRVIGSKMSKKWTQNSRSPTIQPLPAPPGLPAGATPEQQAAAQAYKTCQDQAAADPAGDKDADGIANATESQYGLDPCTADTDGDGLIDGYEFYSAIDLNGNAYPYPGKKPWPNPLDPSDTNYDFDGDGLLMWQEYKLWQASGAHFPLTAYSDGTQNSGGTHPVTSLAESYLDNDGDHNLTDDERDFDGDGLSNMVEFNTRGTQSWWQKLDWRIAPHHPAGQKSYIENWYSIRAFSDLDPLNADSDGDGIPDGADDQDNDGWSNFTEMQLTRERIGYRVHPFNPCLPDPNARVCSRYLLGDEGKRWPPNDVTDQNTGMTSQMPDDAIPFAWVSNPRTYVTLTDWINAGSPVPSPDPVTGGIDPLTGPWDPSPWFRAAWDGSLGPQGS